MPTIWQQLGAYVVTAEALDDAKLDWFAKAGGRWIVPILLGDNASGPWNLAHIEEITTRAAKRGIRVGGWFNGWGGDPEKDAQAFADVTRRHQLRPCIADLEIPYRWPDGNPNLMPDLVRRLRAKLGPDWPLGVTTYELNSSMIWNGRTLTPALSFYDLGVRCLPQWYTWIYRNNGAYRPDVNMAWLKKNAGTDPNFRDQNAPSTSYRGLPLSYVHGAVEATGVEGADLADELLWLAKARTSGLTPGFQIYPLERTPDGDFALLEQARAQGLFLV